PTLAFAQRAAAALGSQLLHCQEAILPGQETSVVLAVLRSRERQSALEALHRETAWRGNVPALHVIDHNTWDAIQQLVATGLLTLNTRATRPLTGEAASAPPALTFEQFQRISDLKAFAAKKEKVARFLIAEDLADEAEPQQRAAAKALAQAHAIENRLPEPLE
ncbi:MAG: hypothetical protein WCS43_16015, partial [Verrucomicrobiota bacterium]